ncbi:MAG TPA: hypothetical protein VFW96_26760 [Thermomicrobiales bacterium]|nr:hypothetical protein [Thermomicrobiales bacterium]
MIDRTEFDLRLAAHHMTTARCNARAWQRPSQGSRRPLRATLAGWRAALTVRGQQGVVFPAPRPGLARR